MNTRCHDNIIESSSLLRSTASPISSSSSSSSKSNSLQDSLKGGSGSTALYGSIKDIENNSKEKDEEDDTIELNNDDGNIVQAILSLALPALAGLIIDPLMTLADTVFVGREATNADSLAGMGSAAALLTFSFYIFNFLCTSTTPLVSQLRASNDIKGAINVGKQSLTLAIGLGILLAIVLTTFSQPLLYVMGTGQSGVNANQMALSFLHVRVWAAPAVFILSASTGILRGFLDTKTTFIVLLGGNIVNFILDVVLITGMGLGPTGAAIATTTAEWICALFFLGILAGKIPSIDGELGSNQINTRKEEDDEEPIIITPATKPTSWESIQPLIVASSSVFLRSFVLQICLVGAAAMAARGGGVGVGGVVGVGGESTTYTQEASLASAANIAAYQIALQLWLLCSFICDALAAASQALIADALGRQDETDVRRITNAILYSSIGLGIFLSGMLGFGQETGFLVNFFTADKSTQEALASIVPIIILAQPLNSFVFAADGILQGASEFPFQAKSMALSSFVGIASFYYLEYLSSSGGSGSSSIDYSSSAMVVSGSNDTLVNVWFGLIALQAMRGLTSIWKLVDASGPIDLLTKREKSYFN